MIDFLVDNWLAIGAIATVVLATIAQLLTPHADKHGGLLRLVLLAIDLLSFFKDLGSASHRSTMRGLPLKLPLLQRSPATESEARRRVEALKRGY